MIEFGLCLLEKELESYDTFLCEKKYLRPDWYIVRKDETTLLISPELRAYYCNKEDMLELVRYQKRVT